MRTLVICGLVLFGLQNSIAAAPGKAQHIIVIVWDGMRPDFVTREHAPTLYELARNGVFFENHHSTYCTMTEVNGTAMATGAYPSHSGVFANSAYLPDINPNRALGRGSEEALRKGDELSDGHYLMRPTVAETLRRAGLKTAIAGSKRVALLHDRALRPDDPTSSVTVFEGQTLPPSALGPITNKLGVFPKSPSGDSTTPNRARDEWTTRALLENVWGKDVPEFTLLWLSEPDHSQHAAGPGAEKSLNGIKSSDALLAMVLAELDRRNIRDKTDVLVVSDHGFNTVEDTVDVCAKLQKAGFPAVRQFQSPPKQGDVLVVGQGGSVLFYVIGKDAALSRRIVDFLQQQNFAGVLFTREKMAGTFSLSDAHVDAKQAPDIVMSMRWTFSTNRVGVPGQFTGDNLKINAGHHASMSRFDVHNTLVASGPDFKKGYRNEKPSGNTDLAPTILWLLGVKPEEQFDGRVLSEALTVTSPRMSAIKKKRLEATRKGEGFVWQQYLQTSRINDTVYLDEGNSDIRRVAK